jgi:hypothetical protein
MIVMEKRGNKSQQIINVTSSFHSNVTNIIYYFLTKCVMLFYKNIPSCVKRIKSFEIEINGRQDFCRFSLWDQQKFIWNKTFYVLFDWGNARMTQIVVWISDIFERDYKICFWRLWNIKIFFSHFLESQKFKFWVSLVFFNFFEV